MYPQVQHPDKWTGIDQWNAALVPAESSTCRPSSEPLHNFLPTLKLSLYHFGDKSLVVMDFLTRSISEVDRSLAPPLASSHPEIFVPNSQSLGLTSRVPSAPLKPDRWISNVSSLLFSQLVTIFCYFRLTSLIPALCWNRDYRNGAMGGGGAAKWLTDELPFLGRSSLKPRRAIPTSARASLYDL